jgi:hypothetical protein
MIVTDRSATNVPLFSKTSTVLLLYVLVRTVPVVAFTTPCVTISPAPNDAGMARVSVTIARIALELPATAQVATVDTEETYSSSSSAKLSVIASWHMIEQVKMLHMLEMLVTVHTALPLPFMTTLPAAKTVLAFTASTVIIDVLLSG